MAGAFTLDTSGTVPMDVVHGMKLDGINFTWSDLTPFAQGYVEALFADADKSLGEVAIHDFGKMIGFSDLAPEALARIIADCEAIAARTQWMRLDEAAGREAWRLRQASSGFYGFLPATVTLGDDGKVRVS